MLASYLYLTLTWVTYLSEVLCLVLERINYHERQSSTSLENNVVHFTS